MEADILRAEEAIRNANLAVSVSLHEDNEKTLGLWDLHSYQSGLLIH